MDTTFSHLKSHFISGYRKGTTKPPLAPSMWILMSQPFSLLSLPGTQSMANHQATLLLPAHQCYLALA